MNVRAELANDLRDALPSYWNVIEYETGLGQIDQLTLMVRQQSVAYISGDMTVWQSTIQLSIISPHEDLARAEDELDDGLEDLLKVLTGLRAITINGATKRVWEDRYALWDVDVTVAFQLT